MSSTQAPQASRAARFADAWNEYVPIGLAPSVILLITALSGLLILFSDALGLGVTTRNEGDVTMWVFAAPHYDAYRDIVPGFEQEHGTVIGLSQISNQVLSRKFHAAARAGLPLPDLIEVENSQAGSLFRGPPERVPFVDVMPLLHNTRNEAGVSLYDRMVTNRFPLYRDRGTQYGIPHDVHPVLLAYRRDIFEQRRDEVLAKTGVDILDEIPTWEDFVNVGRVLADPGDGVFMVAMDDNGAGSFEPLFYQRGGDFFDAHGNLTMDSDIAVDLITWMIPLVRDRQRRIAYHTQWGPSFNQKLLNGTVLTFVCADWRCGTMEHNIGDLKGKVALMKLPAWEAGGLRTTTWGGTMLGLPKQDHLPPEEQAAQLGRAWDFAQAIYFDEEKLKQQMVRTKILPPFKDAWDPAVLDRPDPYWSDQPVLRMYADVADDIPARNGSPFLELAKAKTGEAVSDAAAYYSEHGEDGFEDFVRRTLKDKADYIRAKMKRNPF